MEVNSKLNKNTNLIRISQGKSQIIYFTGKATRKVTKAFKKKETIKTSVKGT